MFLSVDTAYKVLNVVFILFVHETQVNDLSILNGTRYTLYFYDVVFVFQHCFR